MELCSYYQKNITLTIDVGRSSGTTTTCFNDPTSTNQSSSDPTGKKQCSNDDTSTNHDATVGTPVDSAGVVLSSKEYYKKNYNFLKILAVMCHGLKNEDDSDKVDFDKNLWASLKVSMYHPRLLEWRNKVRQRARINITTKQAKQLSKKDDPLPSQRMITKCQMWLKTYALTDPSDVIFLCSEMHAWLKVVAEAVEQKKSEEQKLLSMAIIDMEMIPFSI